MSAESALYSALSADSGVTAIVSTRIYPDVAPQEATLPAVGYARLETQYEYVISSAGPIAEDATIEVVCMGSTRVETDALCNAVQTACAGARFNPVSRRAEYDQENQMWATVLTVTKFSNL